jgi:NADPH:quinone reductase-like Zn-dependent oxidoreductase
LKPKGTFVLVGGGGANEQGLIGPMVKPIKLMLVSPFVSQKLGMILAELNQDDLALLADLMQSGKVKPVIDRTYKLSDVPDAIRYVEQGHARGKVIITAD